jgi:hypothetical protein
VIPGAVRSGSDPARAELLARQAEDHTIATRMYALEQIALDGFPRVGGATVETLERDGLIRKLVGRVPFELTLQGVETLIENREATR